MSAPDPIATIRTLHATLTPSGPGGGWQEAYRQDVVVLLAEIARLLAEVRRLTPAVKERDPSPLADLNLRGKLEEHPADAFERGAPMPDPDKAAMVAVDLDIATALDAAREQGRWEREEEIVGWLREWGSVGRVATGDEYADEIERGAGRKETM